MTRTIDYDGRLVGDGCRTLVIAEIGTNHNMDIGRAEKLIEAAAVAGADVVKFQSLDLAGQYHESAWTTERRALYETIALPHDWYPTLIEMSRRHRVGFLCTPTYDRSIELLEAAGAPAYKIASVQSFGDHETIRRAAATQKPIIISSGLSNAERLLRAVAVARSTGNRDIAVLHCVARYPTEPKDLNLLRMKYLADVLDVPVGFSDHTMTSTSSAFAVAMGASIIERHLTLDRTLAGPDHAFAAEPDEFAEMVKNIRDAEVVRGDPYSRPDGLDEEGFRRATELKVVLRHALEDGATVSATDVQRLRAPSGIPAETFAALPSPRLLRAKKAGEVLQWSDVRFEEA